MEPTYQDMLAIAHRAGLVTCVVAAGCLGDQDDSAATAIVVGASDLVVLGADSLLHDVRDLAVTDQGVWVLSAFEPHLYLFSRTGELKWTAGARGQGPREFGTPWSLVLPAPGDSAGIVVWDAGDRRLERFDAAGRHVGAWQLVTHYGPVLADFEETYYGEPLRVRRLGDDVVLSSSAGQTSQTRSLWASELTIFSRAESSPAPILSFSRFTEAAPETFPDVFAPVPLWATCGSDELLVLDPLGSFLYRVTRYGVADSTAVTLPRAEVTDSDVRGWAEYALTAEVRDEGLDPGAPEIAGVLEQFLRDTRAPELATPVTLRCDAGGSPWVQAFSTDSDPRGYGRTWHRLDDPLLVSFPEGFQPHVFTTDRVYGILTDALGVERVAWVESTWE